ncbi:MAG: hypothetical protein KTR20_08540 [Cellvibrionaceae bacterium]|nr:hypothetical protein [Cellvibrionaceae bacterium]
MSVDEEYLQKLMRTLSHDIGGTLRTAVGFSTLLLEGYSEQLDEKAQNWLHLIKSQGEKTQEQLIALSRYARLYGVEDVKRVCDLQVLCAEAILSLQTLYPDFSIEVGTLPRVLGYERLWTDYFAEIIANSARHCGAVADVSCRIYAESTSDTLRIIVEDNGLGMTDKQMAVAVLPFRSIESSTPAGVGIGLAIATRILQLHDGDLVLQASANNPSGLSVVAELPIDIVSAVTA